jgi:hypothetical protein
MTLNEARIEKNNHPEINEMHGAILLIVPVEETAQNDFRNRLLMRLKNNESLEKIAEQIDYLNQLYEDNYHENTFELRYLRAMINFIDEFDLYGKRLN